MDITSIALAVDSTQVNSASAALQKMADQGFKAESVVVKLGATSIAQGRALNTGIAKGADGAADSIKHLTGATSSLAQAQNFGPTTSALAATAAQANAATRAVTALGAAVAATGSAGAGIVSQTAARITAQPVAVAASRTAPITAVDGKSIATATKALDGLADQTAKARNTTDSLTAASQALGNALGTGVAPSASRAAASIHELAVATRALNAAQGLSPTAGALGITAAQANTVTAAINRPATVVPSAAAPATPSNAVTAPVTNATTATTNSFGAAAAAAAKQSAALGQANKLTSFQTQQLHFQLHDFFVQVASGQSPMTAFIQQGSQLSGTFGGAGGAFRAVLGMLTPMVLGIGAAAAAVGSLGFAFYQGAKQSREFADAMVLSGNFAGQTEGQFNALAKATAESGRVTVGAAREFAQALVATGEIGPQVFAAATEAAAAYGQATGKTAQEVAKDFAAMARAPAKFALEANRSLNFITAAQMASIKSFEDSGRAADAQGVIYDALNERLKKLEPNLGALDRALRAGKNTWSQFWNAAFDIGRTETIEDKLASVAEKLRNLPSAQRGPFASAAPGNAPRAALLEEQAGLQKKEFRQSENAAAEAFRAQTNKDSIAADTVIEGYRKKSKAASLYKEKLDELNEHFRIKTLDGAPVSEDRKAEALAGLKKEFAGPKGPKNNEASQVMREQLADDLGAFKAALDAEKQTLAFHQREMQGVYQAGGISLKAFFDDKRTAIADGVKAELVELDKEIARLKEYHAAIKDPSEKVKIQKQINQVGGEKTKLQTAADREVTLSNQQEAASFKALTDSVTNYRANLLQMQGDELGAARLRAQIAVNSASVLAKQGAKDEQGNVVEFDIEVYKRKLEITNQFAEAQRRAGDIAQNTARAEEAAYLLAETSGKSLLETENAVYSVRSRAVDQLGILAAKARELAEASTDPKIKQFAADLALQYAKAADAVDPALNRLRDANRELSVGIAGSLNSGLSNFGQAYADRRRDANADIRSQKDEYSRKISQLEGYLATTQDKNDKARLRAQIKDLEGKRAGAKGEGKGSSLLKTISASVLEPIGQQVFATLNKTLITDPLQKYLEVQLKGLTEGDGLFAGFFKEAMGIKDAKVDPKVLAEQAAATATDALSSSLGTQTSAVQESTAAMSLLAEAARNAAGAVGSKPTFSGGESPAIPATTTGDFARLARGQAAEQTAADQDAAQAQADARQGVQALGSSTASTAMDVAKLAAAAGQGSTALSLLPSIVNLFQAAVATSGAGGGGSSSGGMWGSIIGAVAGYFTGGSDLQVETVSSGAVSSNYVSMADSVRGGRAIGGEVGANSLYRVNENGAEMLEVDGAQYLMMGKRGGKVISNSELTRQSGAQNTFNAGDTNNASSTITNLLRTISHGASTAAAAHDNTRHTENNASSVTSLLHTIANTAGNDSTFNATHDSSKHSTLASLLQRVGVERPLIDRNLSESVSAMDGVQIKGARELGGPVSKNSAYRVNEKRPELLQVAGKQYLMMGSQNGTVEANPESKGQRPINQVINFHSEGPINRSTQSQVAAAAYKGSQRASSRNN